MISTMIKLIILVVMVLFIAWAGVCAYTNFIAEPETGMPKMPEVKDAAYDVYIDNTGNLLLTNDYEAHGDTIGSRVFILHGYWELSGQEFRYRKTPIVLDEKIFGKITIKRR